MNIQNFLNKKNEIYDYLLNFINDEISLNNQNVFDIFESLNIHQFKRINSMTHILIPSIGEESFSECSSLTHVSIPSSLTSIGKIAFKGYSSLSEVSIPSSLTEIEEGVFNECSSLKISLFLHQ